MITAEFMLL